MIGVRSMLVAAGAATACAAQAVAPDVSYVQFPGGAVQDGVLADLDGDGREDLVVSFRQGDGSGRALSLHMRRDASPAFRTPADRVFPLVRDVVVFAVADVDPNPGAELVLFSPTRVVAVLWREGAVAPEYVPIAHFDLLWQPADAGYAPSWQAGVVDLDHDGLDDLVLPGVDGFGVFVQRRDGERARFVESFLRFPPRPVTDRERGEARFQGQRGDIQVSLGDDGGGSDVLFEVDSAVAPPRVADWDADGRADVTALVGARFAVWLQAADGSFAAEPSALFDVPERGIPLFDPSRFLDCLDLDGDGRAEVVQVSGRTEDDAMTSVVEVFRQGEDGALFEQSADRLLLQGFVSSPQFDDVDGDGVAELAIGSLRTELIDTLSGGSSGSVDAQLNLFVGRGGAEGGRFRRPVAMVRRVSFPSRALRERDRIVARFAYDVDHDGLRDLFLRTDGRSLKVLPVTARGRGFELGEPLWEISTAENSPIRFVPHGAAMSLVVREPEQILHVEFR